MNNPRNLFREFNDEKLEQVRTHPYFAKLREKTIAKAEEYMVTEPPIIKFSMIHLYVTTGNRKIFERVYNNYGSRMHCYFLAYLITNDDKYIEPLADIIWNICDFESWTIPAHVSEKHSIERRRRQLDLCSTITGFRISEILYYIGDKLPELVARRAKAEVRYRIIDSYKKYKEDKSFWWMECTNNWAAVCIAAVLGSYLYQAEENEIEEMLPYMLKTAECYLRGFEDDGCCAEGYGYWNYGFSFFCVFASMLRDYTDGRINYFEDERVHNIAFFQQNICMNDKQCLSFSDGGLSFNPSPWLTHFLKGIYPDMSIPSIPPCAYEGAPLRYVFWQNPDLAESEFCPTSHIFHDVQWFLCHKNGHSVGAKAGHNAEPHNHNDVGSFLVSKNGKVTFVDPCGGEYTRQYFSSERYNYMVTSSRGHSVPIINGNLQVCGDTKSTVINEAPDRFTFTMEQAYNDPTLKSLIRDFDCREDKLVLTDTFKFDKCPVSVVERFVSLLPIEVSEGKILCGESVLLYSTDDFTAETNFENVPRGGYEAPVYYVDLKAKKPSEEMTFTFVFE